MTNIEKDETNIIASNFVHNIIDRDLEDNTYGGHVHTRFPPEPNGYLHIGHAKSICLNFGTADKYNGLCNLRFDDTNPIKEDVEYIESIKADIKWLGFDWEDRLYFASDYFDKLYEFAEFLIKKGKAYVCDLTAEEIRQYRGTLTEAGVDSPYRNRSIAENLDLFKRMKDGEFADGMRVLRAKIDMSLPNLNMRDPVIYRISHTYHHRTGDKWCIYPMYDYAHPISDALENITHSICTLEFEDHRPLYDWSLSELEFENPPKQIEFARLDMTNTVMSKRKLKKLVDEASVDGWDDPRMPTICGLRRKGYTPDAIRDFCDRIGVAKKKSIVDIALLEHCIREDLKLKCPRVMAVLNPLKLIITNYPEGKTELLDIENNQENIDMGIRKVPFTRELYIEQDDFMEEPPKKYFRLYPGSEVRLKGAYIIRCEDFIKDGSGKVTEVHCSYDPLTKSGSGLSDKKVKGILHWVSKDYGLKAEIRLYDHIFAENSDEEEMNGSVAILNPNSQVTLDSYVEPCLKDFEKGASFQFIRQGYFCIDTKDTDADNLVLNRTVPMKSSYKVE